MSGYRRPRFNLHLGDTTFCLGAETKIMGVLNVTPDSFSDGGQFARPSDALGRALRMQEEGAHLIDIGGESTRPGAKPVGAREEIKRILPVFRLLAGKIQIPLSIDTYKEEVAQAALDEGAVLVNDVCALKNNKRLAKRIARYRAGVVLMHMQGSPRTMQRRPRYRDLIKEVSGYLKRAIDRALEAGIPRQSIMIDPGFGFGKTPLQNGELLSHLQLLAKLKCPVMAGLSRKSFIGQMLGDKPVSARLYGSLGAAAAAIDRGAHVLRVHDVLAHRQLAALMDSTLLTANGERE